MSRPGVPFPSEAICTRNHQVPALSSRTGALPAPGPPPPPQGLSRVPTAGTPTGAQCLGLSGKGTGPQLLPRPWGSEEKRVRWGSGEDPWSARTPPSPGGPLRPLPRDSSYSGFNAWVGPGGLGLSPPALGLEDRPSPTFSSPGGRGPRSSRASAQRRGTGARSSGAEGEEEEQVSSEAPCRDGGAEPTVGQHHVTCPWPSTPVPFLFSGPAIYWPQGGFT
nr:uncharacterized protein LOC105883563 isoform X2 [Microcebus murinus]